LIDETALKIRLKIENVVEHNIHQKAFSCSILDNYAFLTYYTRANRLQLHVSAISLTAFKQINNENI
jgi:hypothetical protein